MTCRPYARPIAGGSGGQTTPGPGIPARWTGIRTKAGSIRTRLLVPMVAAIVLVDVVAAALLWWRIADQAFANVRQRALAIAKVVAPSLRPGLAFEDLKSIDESIAGTAEDAEMLFVGVVDAAGTLLGSRGGIGQADIPHLLADSCRRGGACERAGVVHVKAPVLFDGRPIGSLVIGLSARRVREAIAKSQRDIALSGAVLLLLGVFGVVSLSHRILDPVLRLTDAARRLGAGDYSIRVDAGEQDEIGVLASTFNAMAGALEFSRREIEEHSRTLETRIEERAAELKHQTERALEASRLKSEFLANMSHEIRTPLNGILGFAGLLIDSEPPPEQQEYATLIRDSGNQLLEVVNDILDLSKIEADRMRIESIPFNPLSLAREALAVVEPRAREKGLYSRLIHGEGVPESMIGDPVRVRQILLNLLGNAIKFTDRGGLSLGIEAAGADAIRYLVTDTGIGIPPEKREIIFEAFTQADGSTTRKYGGTGLGLTISRRLAGLMRGTVDFTSEVGKGSTFWLTLPHACPEAGRTARAEAATPAPARA